MIYESSLYVFIVQFDEVFQWLTWYWEAYSEPSQTSKMKLLAKIVNGQKP